MAVRSTGVMMAAVLLAAPLSPACAQLPEPNAPRTTASSAAPVWLREIITRDVACTAASNGCEVCSIANGRLVGCSLPGIACQPASWSCTRSAGNKGESLGNDVPPRR